MLYSRPCELAIRAAAYLARQPQSRLVRAAEIATAENIPGPFLARVLHQLVRGGLLLSQKGPTGGFQLARPARQINLSAIVAVVDGLDGLDRCAVGLARCSDDMPCPLHEMWKDLRGRMRRYLDQISLAEMGQAVERKGALTDVEGR